MSLLKKTVLPVFILLALFSFAFIDTVNAKSSSDVEEKTTAAGNKYAAGTTVDVNEDVEGDVVSVAEEVNISGMVGDNGYILAGKTLIDNTTEGDLTIIGGYVVVNGDVNGDLRIMGGKVFINSLFIEGDLTVIGGEVSISADTSIGGEKSISSGNITENAVNNPVDLSEAEDNYFSNIGKLDLGDFVKGFTVLFLVFKIIMFIGSFFLAYFIIKVFPSFSHKTIRTMEKDGLMSMGIGLGLLAISPIVAFILLISVFGIKLLIFIALIFILGVMLSQAYANYLVGEFVLRKVNGQKNSGELLTLLVGFVIVEVSMLVLDFIPIIGWMAVLIINIVVISLGIGAMALNKARHLK